MSKLKEAIRRQLDTSGTLLLRASKTLTDKDFFSETPTSASVAWTLNHLAALQDWSVNRVFKSTSPKMDRSTREAFKGGRPVTDADRDKLGSKSEIEANFAQEQFETIRALDTFDDDLWNVSTLSGCRFPTYGILWEHLATHNFWHLGAISVSLPQVAHLVQVAPRFYTVDPQDDELNSDVRQSRGCKTDRQARAIEVSVSGRPFNNLHGDVVGIY